MKELDSFTVERLEKWIAAGEAAKDHHDGVRVAGEYLAALARIALAAKRAEPNELADAVNEFLAVLDNYPEQLVPINRNSVPVKDLRKALSSDPQLNSPEIPDGWVKCSDHRPERGTDVQVYCSDTREQFVAFHIGNGEFQYAQHEDTSVACRPSHWMPLPAAPEKP
ncbi:Protein of uncharacterised function (DUF551) [Yersinia massiliensis]|uniref:DUF551 domain-containing protein n=1 Tax=Yersinia massiliensis TaxID=419257 RepID=UPI0005E06F7C|nr:DUF551 domain-containing protein [Yersinia massiliensis]CNI75720.1 Protein of uncharacterised function (DUF551) [Yersinia massiliensis]